MSESLATEASRATLRPMVEQSDKPVIQCSTGPFWAYELEHAMDALAEAGFTEIELMVTRDPQTQDPEIPLRLARQRGLHIGSVHGPFLVLSRSVWGGDPIEKIRRGVRMCQEFGATSYIIHPPYLWERDFARWIIEECRQYSADTGVLVSVETMYPKWVAGRQLRAHRWLEPVELLEAAPHVVLDTSHLAVGRRDILEALDVLAPKLVHVHLSNNARDGRDGHLELEKGMLPIDRFLTELHRLGFAGQVSLELSVIRYLERPKELVEMLVRNREYVEKKLTGRTKVSKGLPRKLSG